MRAVFTLYSIEVVVHINVCTRWHVYFLNPVHVLLHCLYILPHVRFKQSSGSIHYVYNVHCILGSYSGSLLSTCGMSYLNKISSEKIKAIKFKLFRRSWEGIVVSWVCWVNSPQRPLNSVGLAYDSKIASASFQFDSSTVSTRLLQRCEIIHDNSCGELRL